MKRSFLLSLFFAPLLLCAQTSFYIDYITVAPAAPTTSDPITITVGGNLASSNAYIASASHVVVGNTVQITIVAAASGIGLPVLTPHSEAFSIGLLPAGSYTITIGGTGILDSAPSPQHLFAVSGGGGSPCDSMIVDLVQWSPFSDTALVVHLFNNGSGQFNYPNWILFNSMGDTLAIETVDLFAIIPGSGSWHKLIVQPGVVMPTGSFTGTLELWSDFGTVLACTFNWTGQLCPTQTCVEVYPQIYPSTSTPITADVDWYIADPLGTTVASGVFELNSVTPSDLDTACLAPGEYVMGVSSTTAPDSSLGFFVGALSWYFNLPFQYFTANGLPDEMPFTFYEQCIDSTNSIAETSAGEALTAWVDGGTLRVRGNRTLGTVELLGADGRVILRRAANTTELAIPTGPLAPGIYLVRSSARHTTARVFVR